MLEISTISSQNTSLVVEVMELRVVEQHGRSVQARPARRMHPHCRTAELRAHRRGELRCVICLLANSVRIFVHTSFGTVSKLVLRTMPSRLASTSRAANHFSPFTSTWRRNLV